MQISSSTGSNTTSTSAFQPVFGAGGSGRKTQQEMIELQQKVTLLENENKRLNVRELMSSMHAHFWARLHWWH